MVPTRAGAGRGRGRGSGKGVTARKSTSEDERANNPKGNRSVRFATRASNVTSGSRSTTTPGRRSATRNGNRGSRFPTAPSGPRKTTPTHANGQNAGLAQGSSTLGGPNAQTFQQRYQSLKLSREKERAAAIAAGVLMAPGQQIDLDKAVKPRGTCQDMCPEFERVERVVQNDVWAAEVDPGSEANFQGSTRQTPDEARMVKKFRRSAAGLDEQLPSDLRPPVVLKKTLDYLFNDVIGTAPLASVHHFVWDRTRAIRNDFSIQQITKAEDLRIAVDCFERIARFHITSIHHLATPEKPYDKYDTQQEREQLDKTLLSLIMYYDDSRGKIDSPNEAEFRSYLVIFQIQDPIPDLEDRIQTWPAHIVQHPRVQRARELYSAATNTTDSQGPLRPRANHPIAQADWRKFWKIVQSNQISYLMACVAEIYFNVVRKMALQAIAIAYKRGGNTQNPDWKIEELLEVFGYDDETQVEEFLDSYGVAVTEDAHGIQYLDLKSVTGRELPDSVSPPKQIRSEIVEIKRYGRTLPAVMNGLSVRDAKAAGLIEMTVSDDEMNEDMEENDALFVPDSQIAMKAPAKQLNPVTPEFRPPAQSFPTPTTNTQQQPSSKISQSPFPQVNNALATGTISSGSSFNSNTSTPAARGLQKTPEGQSVSAGTSPFNFANSISTKSKNSLETSTPSIFSQLLNSQTSQQPPPPIFNFGTPSTINQLSAEANNTRPIAPQKAQQQPPAAAAFKFLPPSTENKPQHAVSSTNNTPTLPQPNNPKFTLKPSQTIPPAPAPTLQSATNLSQTPFLPSPPSKKIAPAPQLPPPSAVPTTPVPAKPAFTPPKEPIKSTPVPPPGPSAKEIAKIASKKSKLLDKVAETMMVERGGLLDHFIEFIVGPMILKVQAQVEAEEMQRQADEFRRQILSRRYGERWRQICWNRRLLRRGKARRKRLTRDADVRSRHSRDTSITSQLEAFREGLSRSSRDSSRDSPMEVFRGEKGQDNAVAVFPPQDLQTESRPPKRSIPAAETQTSSQSLVDRSRNDAFKPPHQAFHRLSQHHTGLTPLEKYNANAENPLFGYASPARNTSHRTDTTRSSYFKLKAMGIDPSGERLQVPPSPVHLELKRQRSMESELVAVPEAKRISPAAPIPVGIHEQQRQRQLNGIPHLTNHYRFPQQQLHLQSPSPPPPAMNDDPVLAAARASRQAMAEGISFFREETAREEERALEQEKQQHFQQQQQKEQERQRLLSHSNTDGSRFRISKFLPRDKSNNAPLRASASSSLRTTRPFTESLFRRSASTSAALRLASSVAADKSTSNARVTRPMGAQRIDQLAGCDINLEEADDDDVGGSDEDDAIGDVESERDSYTQGDYADATEDDDLEDEEDSEEEEGGLEADDALENGNHNSFNTSAYMSSAQAMPRHDSPWSGKGGTSIEDAIEL